MSDLADLATHDDRRVRPGRRRAGRLVALLLFLVVIAALGIGGVLGAQKVLGRESAPDYSGDGTGQVLVQVRNGQTASEIATTLHDDGVVKSAAAFRKAATADDRSRSVQPGFYRLRSRMSAAAAVTLLLDPEARARTRVTLAEGLTLSAALQKIADATEVPIADLQKAVSNPAALGLPAYAGGQVEGFLYPATYDIEPGPSAVDALRQMTSRFTTAAADLGLEARAATLGQTPYQVLITASLIEKETAFAADRPKVARVVDNRLAAGMPLQFDSTVNYVREEKKARLTLDDLKQESAYNTYTNKGLPPTPIDSPGEAAIDAALNPAEGDWIYFVTTAKDGSSLFTSDYAAFLAAKAQAKAAGVY